MPGKYVHNRLDETDTAVSEMQSDALVIEPQQCSGLVYFLPTPKSPHGVDVDPSGELIVAGGKLATVLPVHSFSKMQKAIADKAFDGEVAGIPILKYDATIAGEVPEPGLGPLHTEFDGKGFAYTSVFISSEIVKWSLKDFKVVDRTPTYYSIGHLMIPGGDSRKPFGKYVVALNKITKDRYLPTGPELTQSAQLYSIEGDKMRLLLDFPTVGEPHYAQAIPASLIVDKQKKFYALAENRDPKAARKEKETKVVRQGTDVHVYLTAIRSHFTPDNIEGIQLGDTVYFHLTNLEQDWDVPHADQPRGSRADTAPPPVRSRCARRLHRGGVRALLRGRRRLALVVGRPAGVDRRAMPSCPRGLRTMGRADSRPVLRRAEGPTARLVCQTLPRKAAGVPGSEKCGSVTR